MNNETERTLAQQYIASKTAKEFKKMSVKDIRNDIEKLYGDTEKARKIRNYLYLYHELANNRFV